MSKLLVILSELTIKLKAFISSNTIEFIKDDHFLNKISLSEVCTLLYVYDVYNDIEFNFDKLLQIKDKCSPLGINHIIICLPPKILNHKLKDIQNWRVKTTIIYKPFIWDYLYEKKILGMRNEAICLHKEINDFNFNGISEKDFLIILVNIFSNKQYHGGVYKLGERFDKQKLEKFFIIRETHIENINKVNYYHNCIDKDCYLLQTRGIHEKLETFVSWLKNNRFNIQNLA